MGTPRSLHGAIKQGWFPVEVTLDVKTQRIVSHLGLCIWADRNCREKYLSFLTRDNISAFVFKSAVDATWFSLRWS